MKFCRKWITLWVVLIFFLNGLPALAQDKVEKATTAAPDGVEALVELLKGQGVIKEKDAAAFLQGYHKDNPDRGLSALVDLLKDRNILKPGDAAAFIQRYGGKPLARPDAEEVRLTVEKRNKEQIEDAVNEAARELQGDLNEQVQIAVQDEVAKGLKEKQTEFAKAVPDWSKRVRWGGDIRLRYESDRYDKGNAADVLKPNDPTSLMNTTVDKSSYKYRARLQVTAQVNDKTEVTVGLATGNETNPVSTNTALGNNLNKDKILIDLAYVKYDPWYWLSISGGRMPNPWFSTDLVWDSDLNFDGLAVTTRKDFRDYLTTFLTLGVFPLQEQEYVQTTKYLTGAQIGLEKKSANGIGFKLGLAYYDFHNITGIRNDVSSTLLDWTAPAFQQKGNTLFDINNTSGATSKLAYAANFRELNLTGQLDIKFWDPYQISVMADYVKNVAFDLAEVRSRAGADVPDEDAKGYQFGLSVGHPLVRDKGQWNIALFYKYLEADAVVDAYTDSDFHLGGTNAKGWILRTNYGLMKNVWLSLRWLTANEITGVPMGIDVLQADVNVRF